MEGKKEPEYRIVSNPSVLLPKDRKLVEIDTALDYVERNFLGILNKGKLIGFTTYSFNGKNCFIHWIRQNPNAVKFKKFFGVTPSQYLVEYFIRRGVKSFSITVSTLSGEKFINRITRQGLWEKKGSLFVVEEAWVKQSKVRKVITRKKRRRKIIVKLKTARQKMQAKKAKLFRLRQ